jgi:hypothetical protein
VRNPVGAGLARDGSAEVGLNDRGDAIAGKPGSYRDAILGLGFVGDKLGIL